MLRETCTHRQTWHYAQSAQLLARQITPRTISPPWGSLDYPHWPGIHLTARDRGQLGQVRPSSWQHPRQGTAVLGSPLCTVQVLMPARRTEAQQTRMARQLCPETDARRCTLLLLFKVPHRPTAELLEAGQRQKVGQTKKAPQQSSRLGGTEWSTCHMSVMIPMYWSSEGSLMGVSALSLLGVSGRCASLTSTGASPLAPRAGSAAAVGFEGIC